ncbi:MAG: hypothetical protein ACRDLT_03915 [Solirubrobacteraceae bacterium]
MTSGVRQLACAASELDPGERRVVAAAQGELLLNRAVDPAAYWIEVELS